MRDKLRQLLELTLASVLFWSVVMCFFMWIRYYDLENEPGIQVEGILLTLKELTGIGLFVGILIGFLYGVFDYFFDNYLVARLHMGVLLLFKTLSYLILLIFTSTVVMNSIEKHLGVDMPNEYGWWRDNKLFWVFVAYFTLFSLVFSFLKIAKRRFGRGVLFNLLLGRYAIPREEDRIFMFLDMRSSTTIAEQLGHIQYSSFIRDCFLDLNLLLDEYDAEVYQYVGDEAVVSWTYKQGLKRENCIRFFFDFEERLRNRAAYYVEKYGINPEFKAGLHGGKLVVVEVGSVKKELAYHGDVINTSSRIQDLCNTYSENLLISEALLKNLKLDRQFNSKKIGLLNLKGKSEGHVLFAIRGDKKNP